MLFPFSKALDESESAGFRQGGQVMVMATPMAGGGVQMTPDGALPVAHGHVVHIVQPAQAQIMGQPMQPMGGQMGQPPVVLMAHPMPMVQQQGQPAPAPAPHLIAQPIPFEQTTRQLAMYGGGKQDSYTV